MIQTPPLRLGRCRKNLPLCGLIKNLSSAPPNDRTPQKSEALAARFLDVATFWPYLNILASPIALGFDLPWVAIAFSVAALILSAIGLGGFILLPMLIWSVAYIAMAVRQLIA
ncbi:membrane protein [Rhodopirellula europaea SH398]|uniref:Membrane protein n=1 Tax=Rhodopirellula europaea SH398 TaxID=1263868 RepID=M5RVT7_9BACT|nr:membrane protein [Rhodopirellula europaea SH398]